MLIRECSIDWSVDPPELVFTPDLAADELAFLQSISNDSGPNTRMVGTSTASVGLTAETPSGAIDGANSTYSLSRVPATLLLFRNGLYMQGAGNDYTLSGSVVTFVSGNLCQPGDSLIAILT
jgi:hypothetical protein